jgi:hypothetical protein
MRRKHFLPGGALQVSFKSICFYCSLAVLLGCVPAFATGTGHRRAASSHAKTAHHSSLHSRRHHRRIRGQQAIEPDRVMEIQQALVREHYMTGDPDGKWDSTTQAAMQKYQADHGWQTRLMPDSRALKALGLGPDYSGAINAKDVAANNGAPPAPAVPAPQAAGFAAAAGVNQ